MGIADDGRGYWPVELASMLFDGDRHALGLDLVHLGLERALHLEHDLGIVEQDVLDEGLKLLALSRGKRARAGRHRGLRYGRRVGRQRRWVDSQRCREDEARRRD